MIKALIGGSSVTFAPFAVGKHFFEEANLDLQMTYAQTTLFGAALLAEPSVYVLSLGTISTFAATEGGTRYVMGISRAPNWGLFVGADGHDIQDLKGQTIQTGSIGGTQHLVTRKALERVGLDPSSVTFTAGGSSPQRLLAIDSGATKGVVLAAPFSLEAKRQGYRELIAIGDLVPLATTGVAVSTKKLQEDPAEIKAMLRATLKAVHYVLQHPDETIAWLQEEFKLDAEVARAAYEAERRFFSPSGRLTDEEVMGEIWLRQEMGDLPGGIAVDQIADFRLLEEVLVESEMQVLLR